MTSTRTLLLATTTLLALAPASLAQDLHFRRYGQLDGDAFGQGVAGLEDVDGDGLADVAVFSLFGGPNEEGTVSVYSGQDGSALYKLTGLESYEDFGKGLSSIGNLDGDGLADLVISAPRRGNNRGYVAVVAGNTGAVIHELDGPLNGQSQFGNAVTRAGDLNGDGIEDFAVAARGERSGTDVVGAVYLYSGLDASLIRKLTGTKDGAGFGTTLALLGDGNGDGVPELAVGVPYASSRTGLEVGQVRVYSGSNGSLLFSRTGPQPSDHLGFSLANAGDVNGDGIPDMVAGAPGSGAASGKVVTLSGADGAILNTFSGSPTLNGLGLSVCGPGDLDHDGVPDIVAGAPYTGGGAGEVWIWSGKTGAVLRQLPGGNTGDLFGLAVAAAGDMDGDGQRDLIASAPGATIRGKKTGSVTAIRMRLAGSLTYGSGHPGLTEPTLTAVTPPTVNKPFTLQVGNAWAAPCWVTLFLGFQPTQVPTPWGGDLLVVPTLSLTYPLPAGGLQLTGPIPNDPALYGFELFLQGLEADPAASGDIAFTAGMKLVFGY